MRECEKLTTFNYDTKTIFKFKTIVYRKRTNYYFTVQWYYIGKIIISNKDKKIDFGIYISLIYIVICRFMLFFIIYNVVNLLIIMVLYTVSLGDIEDKTLTTHISAIFIF